MQEFTWTEARPKDGERIEAYSVPMDEWYPGTYWNDGDGLIEWDHDPSPCEIEEYGKDVITKWRRIAKSQ